MQKGALGTPVFLGEVEMGMTLFSIFFFFASGSTYDGCPISTGFSGEVPKSLLTDAQSFLLSLTNSYSSFKAHSNVFSQNLPSELLKHLTLSCPAVLSIILILTYFMVELVLTCLFPF